MSKRAIIVIDLQNDFVSGSLAVPSAEGIIPGINWLISDGQFDLVIATRDWHPSNHTSFASQHGVKAFTELKFVNPEDNLKSKLQTVWPDHCVQNTWGAELAPGFKDCFENIDAPHQLVSKGYLVDREYYLAFEDTWGLHHTELDSLLKENNIDEVVICGLALDYCVFHSAFDCAKLGYKTILYTDYSRAIDSANAKSQIDELKSVGVCLEAGPTFDEDVQKLEIPV